VQAARRSELEIDTKCTASEAPGRCGQVWNRSDLLDAAAWLVPWASRRPSARRPVQGGPQETTVQTSESEWRGVARPTSVS